MTKWYQKRDFSIKVPLSFQKKLGKLQQKDASAKTLFQEMWDECEDIAKAVLETKYFKDILNNKLNPNAYGSLMVQDAYYCFKAQNCYTIARTHAYDSDCSEFLKGKEQSYKDYNATYHKIWHIREDYGVIPGPEIKEYADYEAYVASQLDSPYLFAVMLPCEFLWNWVANQLEPKASKASKDGLYYFWIEENAGSPTGARQMESMLELYRAEIDENKAKEIFRTAMEFELKVFTSATILNLSHYGKKEI